jgi:hypothetical protein
LNDSTSVESSSSHSAAKIALPFGCAHQLPTIGWPATASATFGTEPFADASTTPCFATKVSQRDFFFVFFFAAVRLDLAESRDDRRAVGLRFFLVTAE